MYSRIDWARLNSELKSDHYIASLAAKHANLEKAIEDEVNRPAPDCLSLSDLKRRKLRIKDEITRLRATEGRTKRAFRA